MPSPPTPCERCGRPLPRHHSGGNCPWCLFAATLGESPTEFPDEPLKSLADFVGLEEVGRGGTSVVYRAFQVSVQRVVALKVLRGSALAHREAYERLQIEAEAVARLEHPHIVPLYGVGRENGIHFLVLRYFEHGSLASALRSRRFTPEDSARLVITAAQAVHHAHQRGVIHRDLKPSNLLIDDAGHPHVTDFGLARLADQESGLTQTQSIMGTPSYMAPEQARGDRHAVGTPADIYALGAILFELLTGQPPFLGSIVLETLKRVIEEDPPRLKSLVPGISRDLEAICLHCLEKSPEHRYSSAAGLAHDLHRWLHHETLSVRPGGVATQFVRWIRRRPVYAGLTAAVVSSILGGLATTSWQWRRATASERRTVQLLYAANMNLAQADWQSGNLSRLRGLLRETAFNPDRGFEWYYWQQQAHQELLTLHAHTGEISDMDFSPDGRHLVTAGEDGAAKIWEVADGREFMTLPHGGRIHSIEYARDGKRLVSCDAAGVVRTWNAHQGSLELVIEAHSDRATAVLSPNGATIVTAGWDGTVKGWDAISGRNLFTSSVPSGRVKCAAFLHDGRTVLTGGEDRTIRFWDAATGHELRAVRVHQGDVNSISLASDGTRFATAGYDRTVRLWDLPEAQERVTLKVPDVTCVAMSPDGRRLASCSTYNDHVPRVWDIESDLHTAARKLPAHDSPILRIQFSPDGTLIATCCADGTVRFWSGSETRRALGGIDGRRWLGTLAGGHRLLMAGPGGTVTETDAATDQPVSMWPDIHGPVAAAPDGTWVAAVRSNSVVVLLDSHQAVIRAFAPRSTPVRALAFSPDSLHLAAAGPDGAELWNAATGERVHRWEQARTTVQFGPRPGQLVTTSDDGGILWDARSGKAKAQWTSKAGALASFSPDGRWLATAGPDSTVIIRNVEGREIREIPFLPGVHHVTAFSPDATQLATGATWGSADITICDVSSGSILRRLRGHTGFINSLAFTLDGRRLLSASRDGSARLWDTSSGRELLVLRPDEGELPECSSAMLTTGETGILVLYGDGSARLWGAATPEQIAVWEAAATTHREPVLTPFATPPMDPRSRRVGRAPSRR